jgi:hypothetical protein
MAADSPGLTIDEAMRRYGWPRRRLAEMHRLALVDQPWAAEHLAALRKYIWKQIRLQMMPGELPLPVLEASYAISDPSQPRRVLDPWISATAELVSDRPNALLVRYPFGYELMTDIIDDVLIHEVLLQPTLAKRKPTQKEVCDIATEYLRAELAAGRSRPKVDYEIFPTVRKQTIAKYGEPATVRQMKNAMKCLPDELRAKRGRSDWLRQTRDRT